MYGMTLKIALNNWNVSYCVKVVIIFNTYIITILIWLFIVYIIKCHFYS